MNAPASHVSPSAPSKIGRTTECLADSQTAATSPKVTAIISYTNEAISKKQAVQHSAAWSWSVHSQANDGPISYVIIQSSIAPAPRNSNTHAQWLGASIAATTALRAKTSSRAIIRTSTRGSLDPSRPVESSSQSHSSLESLVLKPARASTKNRRIGGCYGDSMMVGD